MLISDAAIRNLKPKKEKYPTPTGLKGLKVWTYPTGTKTFVYGYKIKGKRQSMTIGLPYPHTLISDANKLYLEVRKQIASGQDPALLKKLEQEEHNKCFTVADLAKEYLEKYAKIKKKSWQDDERTLNVEILPRWGTMKAKDISRRQVVLLLDKIVDRGSPVMANRTLALLSKMFNFAIDKGILPIDHFNPCQRIEKQEEIPKDRNLSPSEIAVFWKNLNKPDVVMSDEIKQALKMILITAQRPGEVVGMHSDEINGNVWTIPAVRVKTERKQPNNKKKPVPAGKPHVVWLTERALEIIGDKKGFIFESPKGDCAIGEKALAMALRRNIKGSPDGKKRKRPNAIAKKQQADEARINRLEIEPFTPHDLRRTAASRMGDIKVSPVCQNYILNHAMPDKDVKITRMTKIYDQSPHLDEKREGLEKWSAYLERIIKGQHGKILTFPEQKASGE